MNISEQLASRFREFILNGHWIANTNLNEQLDTVDWQQANKQIGSLNTIAGLTGHLHYYITGVLQVLHGGPLTIRDQYSFDTPPPTDQESWVKRLECLYSDAEQFAQCIEKLANHGLERPFTDEKYGDYLRNIEGMIEHCYYHFGQIVLLIKLSNKNNC